MADHHRPSDEVLNDRQQTDRRKHPRKVCYIPVTCSTSDRLFADHVRNISVGGVFLETRRRCFPGEHLTMMFSFPQQKEPLIATGEIRWRGPEGVGVEFTSPNTGLQEMAESHWSIRMDAYF